MAIKGESVSFAPSSWSSIAINNICLSSESNYKWFVVAFSSTEYINEKLFTSMYNSLAM